MLITWFVPPKLGQNQFFLVGSFQVCSSNQSACSFQIASMYSQDSQGFCTEKDGGNTDSITYSS